MGLGNYDVSELRRRNIPGLFLVLYFVTTDMDSHRNNHVGNTYKKIQERRTGDNVHNRNNPDYCYMRPNSFVRIQTFIRKTETVT